MKKKNPSPTKKSANVVALTGGIGSGKSAVARFLEKWGAAVVDADILARAAVEPGTPGLRALVDRFGGTILDSEAGSTARSSAPSSLLTRRADSWSSRSCIR